MRLVASLVYAQGPRNDAYFIQWSDLVCTHRIVHTLLHLSGIFFFYYYRCAQLGPCIIWTCPTLEKCLWFSSCEGITVISIKQTRLCVLEYMRRINDVISRIVKVITIPLIGNWSKSAAWTWWPTDPSVNMCVELRCQHYSTMSTGLANNP